LRWNYLIKYVTEGKVEERKNVKGGRGRRCKELLNDLKENKSYWELK
jgi:hypothetical protein